VVYRGKRKRKHTVKLTRASGYATWNPADRKKRRGVEGCATGAENAGKFKATFRER